MLRTDNKALQAENAVLRAQAAAAPQGTTPAGEVSALLW